MKNVPILLVQTAPVWMLFKTFRDRNRAGRWKPWLTFDLALPALTN